MITSGSYYRRYVLLTITTVCLLILAGGIVRSTGSGMGCPDWPKCFGQWVPPTSVSQLPSDYQQTYSQKRQQKNLRLARYMNGLGFNELSDRLVNDPTILEEEEFNAAKTWIEYITRLLGAVVGFLFIINVVMAFRLKPRTNTLMMITIANLVLVAFQGWVGSLVVSTNLLGGMITFHMLLALLILALLIYNYWVVKEQFELEVVDKEVSVMLYRLLFVGLVLFVIQVALGTQVREGIDIVAKKLGDVDRSGWIDQLGLTFLIHRSYSLLLLGIHGFIAFKIFKHIVQGQVRFMTKVLILLMVMEILSGIILAYFGVPAFMQPVHLVLATLIFGADVYLILMVAEMTRISQGKPELNTALK